MKLISIRKMKKRINVPANVKMGRICAIWLFCIALQAISIPILAQSAKITLRLKNVTVEEVLTSIENQTEYRFLYNKDIVDVSRIVSITVKNERMTLVLDKLFKGEGVSYTIEKRQIVLNKVSSQPQDNKQPVKVTGKVVDESGEVLPGVTVMIEGATQGTITGIDGNYQLQVPEGSTLKFTSIGYTTYTQKITRPMTLNVTMKEDSKQLDEVVVVGYGTTTRKNLTTSIATVKTEKISRAATSNMSQMLLGRAAGLEATLTSPQPGGAVDLSIRGAGTPIFIVDGVMMPSTSLEVGNGNQVMPNSINRSGLAGLNPADIESIEVLKDASASIYGIGAANGVVLITTKKGTETRPQITYEGNYSIVKNYPYLEPLSGEEYMNVANIFNKENYLFTNGMYPYGDKPFDNKWVPQFSPQQIAAAQTTDWLDCVLKDGSINNHNITITGGSKLLKYYLSGNYYKQEGTVENSAMERYALRTNISSQLLPFLKLTAIVNVNENEYTNSTSGGGGGGNGYDAIQSALTYPSYLPIRGEDGKPTLYSNYPNPAEMIKVSDRTKTSGYYLNFAADVDIIKDMLSFRLMYGINKENANRNLYIPSDIYFMDMYKSRGHLGYVERRNQTMEGTLTFKKQFGDLLRVDAVVGMGRYTNDSNGLELDYEQINDHIAADKVEAAEGAFYPTSFRAADERRSQFARASVDVLDRYVVAATIRRDGTDKFFPGKKYAYFPSVSLAWKLSNEPFMKHISWIDQLKIRGSYGQTGNDNLGSSLYGTFSLAAQYIKFSNNSVTYVPYLLSGPDYPNVTWEKTTMKNIGIDFSVLKDRIWGSFDMFRNDVTNLLGYDSASPLSMTSSVPMNYGHYVRYGWDATINSLNFEIPRVFKWTSQLTLSHHNAVWKERMPNYYYEEYRIRENEPVNAYYYYETEGVINIDKSNMPESQKSLPADAQQPGYPIIKDANGDNKITIDDVKMRNTLPKIHIGFGNTFVYKDFDLDVFMYGQFGRTRYNYAYRWALVGDVYYTSPKNSNKYVYTIWNSQTNQNGNRRGIASTKAVALPGNVGFEEDYQNASFVRVRNITLGYNLSGKKLGRVGDYVSSIRVFVDCQNPFTFTKFVGVDPEIKTGGDGSKAEYPMTRTYSFGAKICF